MRHERRGVAGPPGYAALGPAVGGAYQDVAATARRRLGPDAYAAAFEHGRALSAADARAFALARPADPTDPAAGAVVTGRGASTRAGGTAALSPREAEVAALVATGLSNREVADRLVLSPRTVEGHVERILAKLGFRSRVEIAAWAAWAAGAGERGTADRGPDRPS